MCKRPPTALPLRTRQQAFVRATALYQPECPECADRDAVPCPRTRRDRARYRWELSTRQIEMSRALVFRPSPPTAIEFFDAPLSRTISPGYQEVFRIVTVPESRFVT